MTFYLEVTSQYTGAVMRAQFATKRRANFVAKKLAKEMGKGKFRNDDGIFEIAGMSGSVFVRAGDVSMFNVIDSVKWADALKADGVHDTSNVGKQE